MVRVIYGVFKNTGVASRGQRFSSAAFFFFLNLNCYLLRNFRLLGFVMGILRYYYTHEPHRQRSTPNNYLDQPSIKFLCTQSKVRFSKDNMEDGVELLPRFKMIRGTLTGD